MNKASEMVFHEYDHNGLTREERERHRQYKAEIEKLQKFDVNKLVDEFAKQTGPIKINRTVEEQIRIAENRLNGYLNYITGYREFTAKRRENQDCRIHIKDKLEFGKLIYN